MTRNHVVSCIAVAAILASVRARAEPSPPAEGDTETTAPAPEPDSFRLHVDLYGVAVSTLGSALRVGIGYEKTLADHFTLDISGQFERDVDQGEIGTAADSFGLRVSPHYYLRGANRGGLYLAPFAVIAYDRAALGGSSGQGLGEAIGATIGWSLRYDDVSIKVGVGAEDDNYAVDLANPAGGGKVSLGVKGLAPTFDLSLGFVF